MGMTKIAEIIKNDLCLGCGLCEAISRGKYKMNLNQRGFYEPEIIGTGLNDKICHICPGVTIQNRNQGKHLSIWGNVMQVSNAWAADGNIRRQSSSGGVTSALAIYLLESHQVDGILHVGVQGGTYLYNKLYVSRNSNEVLMRNASRYAPAEIFNHIFDIFESNRQETFAFIGKPCDIAGMQNLISAYPQYRHKVKYYLAIFCAGMPSYKATDKALATFNKNEQPQSLRYRGDGWPGYFTATYKDGTSCRMTYNESWGKILGRDLGFRCKICPDGIGLLADIASGDSWNTKNGYPDFTEADGKNFCFIRTDKGLKLFREAEEKGYIVTESLNANEIQYMQRYQYDRRHLVGWRIAAVQCLTGGILDYHGLGFYRTALKGNMARGIKDAIGTAKRLIKLRKDNGKQQ